MKVIHAEVAGEYILLSFPGATEKLVVPKDKDEEIAKTVRELIAAAPEQRATDAEDLPHDDGHPGPNGEGSYDPDATKQALINAAMGVGRFLDSIGLKDRG